MRTLPPSSITVCDATEQISGTLAGHAESDVLATSVNARREQRDLWNNLIDHTLIEWGHNSDLFVEDGLLPPTRVAIKKACNVAATMREREWPLPTGVIPDGEGGVVFENLNEPSYQRLEIEKDGLMYLVAFRDCTFLSRDLVEIVDTSR